MATKQFEYIRANHIDTISPSNSYNDQQKKELNYIIQILINNDTDRLQRWQIWAKCRKWERVADLAMTLVLAGTSMEDKDIVNWVYNNNYATTRTTLEPRHKHFLNRRGFKIERSTYWQINQPIYRRIYGPYSDDDDDNDDDDDDDAEVVVVRSTDSLSLPNVFVGIYAYTSEENARAHRNPLSSTITKVPNDDDSVFCSVVQLGIN